MKNIYHYALALLGGTLLAASANAATFTTVGDAVAVTYNGMLEGEPVGPATAATYYELVDIGDGGSTWTFSGTLENTSSISSRVSIAGFNTSGLVDLSGSGASGDFDSVGSGSFSNGYSRDFCVKDVPGASCAGGGGAGALDGGNPLAFTFSIHLDEAVDTLDLFDFMVRYQSTSHGNGGVGLATSVQFIPVTQVPLPASGLLLMSALGGLALRTRVQRPTQV